MNSSDKQEVTFEHVEKIMNKMYVAGVTPTIRDVRSLAGCSQNNAIELFNAVKEKRRQVQSTLADEIGSAAIGKLLATELQNMIERETQKLQETIGEQRDQINELNELFAEQETECQSKVSLADISAKKAIDNAEQEISKATERSDKDKLAKTAAEQELTQVKDNTKNEIDKTNTEAETLVKAAEQKAITLIDSAKSEANALVKAANKQIDKAESETTTLRQQVKELSVDQAKHEIEQNHFEQAKITVNKLQIEIAENKTLVVQLQTEKTAFIKDTKRLENDLVETKDKAGKLSEAQTQLVELQKQLSQAQTDLSQAQREITSLSQALSKSK